MKLWAGPGVCGDGTSSWHSGFVKLGEGQWAGWAGPVGDGGWRRRNPLADVDGDHWAGTMFCHRREVRQVGRRSVGGRWGEKYQWAMSMGGGGWEDRWASVGVSHSVRRGLSDSWEVQQAVVATHTHAYTHPHTHSLCPRRKHTVPGHRVRQHERQHRCDRHRTLQRDVGVRWVEQPQLRHGGNHQPSQVGVAGWGRVG